MIPTIDRKEHVEEPLVGKHLTIVPLWPKSRVCISKGRESHSNN